MVEYYPLSATFSVSGKDIYKIKLDQPVEITGATGKKFSGYVSFISPTASESASSALLRFSVQHPAAAKLRRKR